MREKESFIERVRTGPPVLSGIALVIACILGIVIIICLVKMAYTLS